jgi:hypothetical protein
MAMDFVAKVIVDDIDALFRCDKVRIMMISNILILIVCCFKNSCSQSILHQFQSNNHPICDKNNIKYEYRYNIL